MSLFTIYVRVYFALLFFLPALSEAQTANFASNVTTGCFPSLAVQFSDQSSGATSWNWTFGNGNSSTEQNPSAVYSQPGTYDVSLSINGTTTITKNSYITVYAKPVPDFSTTNPSGCAPLISTFVDTSTAGSGVINFYNWVFGDGASSTETSPAHVYNSPSVYSVTLTITNEYGCSATVIKNSIVNARGPTVNFASATSTSFCQAPATVSFNNITTGLAPLSYEWNFGDQTPTDNSQAASHEYTNSGNFDVSLTTTDANGCTITNKKNAFVSIGNEPGVNFILSAEKICIGQSIAITNQITVPVLDHLWDLGNGSQSSQTNATVSYSVAGIYNVILNATMPSGCKVTVVKRVEAVSNAALSFKTVQECDRKITFRNTSQGASTFLWDFGDGTVSDEKNPIHNYSSGGTFMIKTTGYNELNCAATIERTIEVHNNPVATILPDKENACTEISLSGCAPFSITFSNNTSSTLPLKTTSWNFGDDNNNTSLLPSPTHTYTRAGTYRVTLIVINSINCRDTVMATVKVAAGKPVAAFIAEKTSACVKEGIQFINQSSSQSNFWCWDFGDESSSIDKEPIHVYNKPGIYSVTLTAKNAGCSDAITRTQYIAIKDPYIEFEVEKNCDNPYDVVLKNKSADFDSIGWDLGDGATSMLNDNVNHHFQSTGSYDIRLTIKNFATGCLVTDSRSVYIQDIKSEFAPDTNPVCKNSQVAFNDLSQFAVNWSWDFKDGTTASEPSPVKTFTTPGDYTVSLTVIDLDGCPDTKVIPVRVADIEGAFTFVASSTCTDLTVNFEDNSQADPPVQSWLWDFGDGFTSSIQNAVHSYGTQEKFPVRLTLQNSEATCSILVNNAIVFTNPLPDFLVQKPVVCVDDPVTFLNTSLLAQTFEWKWNNTQTSLDRVPVYSFDKPGKYTVELKAKDQYGCERSIIKPDFIEVLQPVANFEAFQTSAECPPLVTTFKDHSSSDVIGWKWIFGDNQSSSLQDPTNVYLIPGNYDVQLEVMNFIGCSAIYTADSLVSLGGPYGNFTVTPVTCVDKEVAFVATTTNTARYIWDFGDGVVIDTDKNELTHHYSDVAMAHLSLTLIDEKECKVIVGTDQKIEVMKNPEVDFSVDPEYPFEGENVFLAAMVGEDLQLIWKADGEIVANDSITVETFDRYGTYAITLTGIDTRGCESAITKPILVQGDVKMIPNVFTPNDGDASNSSFVIEDVEKGFWKLKVFNRWGQRVYSSPEYHNKWAGDELSTGVYYYLLTNTYRQSKEYKGYVQLIR